MKLVRSWPATVPSGRSYVVDDLPRLVMADYDYAVLADVDDDVLLIEWDLAVDPDELTRFAERATTRPGRVLAAPYWLYPGASLKDIRAGRTWSAWRYAGDDQRNGGLVPVEPGAPYAHIVGFGLIYLPQALISDYLAARHGDWGFSDIAFCGWHYRCVRHEIDLDWQARPVHLHYTADRIRIPGGEQHV